MPPGMNVSAAIHIEAGKITSNFSIDISELRLKMKKCTPTVWKK